MSDAPKFIYLLNAMEMAARKPIPSEHGYAGHRAKVLDYVEKLERAAASLSRVAELERETKRLADGLRWYAEGHHYDLPDWDSCSGESPNWLFPPIETTESCWMVDDGGIAQHILNGYSINPNHAEDDEITIPPASKLGTKPAPVEAKSTSGIETSGEVTQKA